MGVIAETARRLVVMNAGQAALDTARYERFSRFLAAQGLIAQALPASA